MRRDERREERREERGEHHLSGEKTETQQPVSVVAGGGLVCSLTLQVQNQDW